MTAIYPGSFDPATNGHLDIIIRASKISETLIVAVLNSSSKNPLFSVEERVEHLKRITKNMPNVQVESFSGLLVDFAKKKGANIIIRGLRALTDFEYEFQMALTNRELENALETLFIPTSIQYLYLSSSVVKEIARYNGNFHDMVPAEVWPDLENKFINKSNKRQEE